ncbi:hypothetical protein GCM10011316_29250 [Roseibium aquae]|uniref:Uncharacterized protein n=1 Tax=Roseibium aquae TaxID=1323746 RepID=A0A916TMG6_9HYPH|nr:hypothetical protein [Roseibium aquae]GGB55345.1 hypothetical protein GCM10011316_29250 [Roseibium aquae]
MRRPRDPYTIDMFKGWTPPRVSVGFEPGSIPGKRLSSRISRAVAKALRESGKDRATIAGQMSQRLGSPVSVAMLDSYAAESKTDHNISVERLIALIHATGKTELLGFLADEFDLAVIPKRYENVIELALIEDHKREIEGRARYLQAKIRSAQ